MSRSLHKEIRCPSCGKLQSMQMWTSITAPEEPEVCQMIEKEILFDFNCKECGYHSLFYYPCLYHDPIKGYMIYLNPAANPQSVREEIPQVLSPLKKRLVSNQAELKEKIKIFDAGLDDAAIEIVKLAAENLVRKKSGTQNFRLHFLSGGEGKICFAVVSENDTEQKIQMMKTDFYRQAQQMIKGAGFCEGDGFEKIDRQFAMQILQKIQAKK